MTIQSGINTFDEAVSDLKNEIIAKGQSVASTDSISSLSNKIANIPNTHYKYSQTVLKDIIEGTIENLYDKVMLYIRPYCFCGCRNLKKARFKNLRKICKHAFNNCVQLNCLILDFYNTNNPNEIVRLDNINAFKYTQIEKGNGKIYVNDLLYNKYLTDNVWSKFSGYIDKISNYIE